MRKVVISDTSVLIVFEKIGELDLLQRLYGKLLTTPEVEEEFGSELPKWISIQSVVDKKYQDFLATQLDAGEASAIALAAELDNALLLLDDLKGRKLAAQLKFKFTGTFGIIHKAKEVALINKVKPLVDKILTTDFRIADTIVKEFLKQNSED